LGSPAKDYTVKVYTKQDVRVVDINGETSVIHMDGKTPSGFTESKYREPGYEDEVVDDGDVVDGIYREPTGGVDLILIALEADNFIVAIFAICWTYPTLCLNPFFWFS
jgi:hypothetical protein